MPTNRNVTNVNKIIFHSAEIDKANNKVTRVIEITHNKDSKLFVNLEASSVDELTPTIFPHPNYKEEQQSSPTTPDA